MNQGQSTRALSTGLITPSTAQRKPVQSSGATRPPHSIWRPGSIGRITANNSPVRIDITPWASVPMSTALALNARSSAVPAVAMPGIATAARRLIGYHRLRWTSSPYRSATSAIATPPTRPPRIPDDSGGTSTGIRTRWPPCPWLRCSTPAGDGRIGAARSSGGGRGHGSSCTLCYRQTMMPPADRGDQGEREADDADREIGDEPPAHQGDAQGEHHRPGGRPGHLHGRLGWAHRAGLHQRPIRYTT